MSEQRDASVPDGLISDGAVKDRRAGFENEKKEKERVKANLDGNYRKDISEEALEAVRKRREEDAKENDGAKLGTRPQRWVPVINSSDSEEVVQLKKRIQKKEEEIQDILRRLRDFDRKLGKVADQIVPL